MAKISLKNILDSNKYLVNMKFWSYKRFLGLSNKKDEDR
jgi:hypothetical protein